jgi:hypothetical protein
MSPAAVSVQVDSCRQAARRNALVKLFDIELRERFLSQVAKLAVILITLGFAIALPFAARGARDASDLVVIRALSWSSWWVAGLVALAACRIGEGEDERAREALVRQHGWSEASVATARSLAVARRTARLVLPSGILLSLVALGSSTSLRVVLPRVSLLLGVIVYVVLLAVTMALLVRGARALSPAHARTALLCLVFVPHVVRSFLPDAPSIPALFQWLLTQLASIGAPR